MKTKALSALKIFTGGYTPYLRADWGDAEREAVDGWLKGANYPGFAQKLDADLTNRLGAGWAVRAVNHGGAAVQLALEALSLPPGSEVLVSTYADASAVTAAMQLDLKPVLVDVDEQFNMRFESVFEAASKEIKAAVVSHIGGCWARDFERIMAWSRKNGVWIIEDARDAQGLVYKGGLAGTFGDIGIYAADGARSIVSSGGAWVVTKNPRAGVYIKTRVLEDEPRELTAARLEPFIRKCAASRSELGKKRVAGAVGSILKREAAVDTPPDDQRFEPYAISGIDARLIMYQLPRLMTNISKRVYHASQWRTALAKLPLANIRYPAAEDNIYSTVRYSFANDEGQGESNVMTKCLAAGGVETALSFVPLHLRKSFDPLRRTSMEFANNRWSGAICMPVWPGMDDSDWKRINTALDAAVKPLVGK